MPNKTIYVSDTDASLFEEAKNIAGEALSSVIVRALKEYVSRHQEKEKGMKEVAIAVGGTGAQREQRFVGAQIGKWEGMSDDKEWWLSAKIYRTQKNKWAVYLATVCKATLFTDKKQWIKNAEYLVNTTRADLFVSEDPMELKNKLPKALYHLLLELSQKDEKPIEYLDI